LVTFVLLIAIVGGLFVLIHHQVSAPGENPVRARIVSQAESQVGYRTDPSNTYCNRFSAYWAAGTDDCGNSNLSEEWCADFAAWTWKMAGVDFTYELAPGDINSDSASFYVWGVDHGTWHPVGTNYVPQPGDVAVYGLSLPATTAQHVAVVVKATTHRNAPEVVNGDGDRTGFSVVEIGQHQAYADVEGKQQGARLSGYVSPLLSPSSVGAGA
jgi:hypothetical protein